MKSFEQMEAGMRLVTMDALESADNIEQAATLLLAAGFGLIAAKYGAERAGSWLLSQALLAPRQPEKAQERH